MRTRQEIQAEYGQLCAVLGETTYKLKKDVENLNARIDALNLEMKAALDAEKEAEAAIQPDLRVVEEVPAHASGAV